MILSQTEYIARGARDCPVCHRPFVQRTGPPELKAQFAVINVGCQECGAHWSVTYTVTSYNNVTRGETHADAIK